MVGVEALNIPFNVGLQPPSVCVHDFMFEMAFGELSLIKCGHKRTKIKGFLKKPMMKKNERKHRK